MRGRPTNRFSIRCMRVRVIASRMSAMMAESRSKAPSTGDVGRAFAKAAGKLVAGEHHVGDGAHHPVEQFDRKADGARRGSRARLPFGERRGDRRSAVPSAPGASASISALSSPAGHLLAGFDRGDHLADAVDDREHGADELRRRRGGGRRGRRRARPRRRGSAPRAAEIRRSRNCPSRCGQSEKCCRAARGRRARPPRRRSRRPGLRAFRGIRLRNRQSGRPSARAGPSSAAFEAVMPGRS